MAASLILPSSPSSSYSSSFLTRSNFFPHNSRSATCICYTFKCSLPESSRFGNGKPIVPILNERSLPEFLESARMGKPLDRSNNRLKLFSGTANLALSQEVSRYMGLELSKVNIKRFADGEIYVQLKESVRGCDVYIIQPTCPPANENLMELFVMIDACRRASAKNITAVIPYFGYARADRKASLIFRIVNGILMNLHGYNICLDVFYDIKRCADISMLSSNELD
ncbi:hypothetical protein IC582_014989 [Cucumis melo]